MEKVQICEPTLQYHAGLHGCKINPEDVFRDWEGVTECVRKYEEKGQLREAVQHAKQRAEDAKLELQFAMKNTGCCCTYPSQADDHLVQLIASECHEDARKMAGAIIEYHQATRSLREAKINLTAANS